MISKTLQHGTHAAIFTWTDTDDKVQVTLKVPQMPSMQGGMMTKEAARLFWNTLISSGYTECPSLS